jgi:DNA-binding transcriptional LysR family regulator
VSMSSHSRFLLEDPLVIVAGAQSRWASRRKIDLAVLLDEQWILSPPNGLSYELVAAVFKAQGLPMPSASMMTNTLDLRLKLLAGGRFLSVVPISALRPASATTPNKAIQLKTAKLNLAPMAVGSLHRMKMPLLASSSAQNSELIWKFLYEFLVTRRPPLPLSATSAPSSMRQLASPVLSSRRC